MSGEKSPGEGISIMCTSVQTVVNVANVFNSEDVKCCFFFLSFAQRDAFLLPLMDIRSQS